MRGSRTPSTVSVRPVTKGVPKKIADGIGLLHFIFANLLVILGELTPWFSHLGWQLSGLRVVYLYVDVPVASFFEQWTIAPADFMRALFIGELVIIASSLLYAIIAYVFVRFLFSIIDF